MINNNRVAAPILVIGLLAVHFIDVSTPVKRCVPFTDNDVLNVKRQRNQYEAKNTNFKEHLEEHARARVHNYLLLLTISNMCMEYDQLEFRDIFSDAASDQDVTGDRTVKQDINTADAAFLRLPSTTVSTFGNTHAAHVCGFGLRLEQANKECKLRKVLKQRISVTTEQVAEVNIGIDKVIDKVQLKFGKDFYKGAKQVERKHFENFVMHLKNAMEDYKTKITNDTKLNDLKKSRFEFYADTYLEVFKSLNWKDVCNKVACTTNEYIGSADEYGWQINTDVLAKC